MKSSDQTNEISGALAKAQGAINNPAKTAINPHFKSKYADLSAGIDAIRQGLSANGIAFVQATRVEGDVLMLDTRLTHSGGQWVESEWPVAKLPAQPQVIGSALTYARRYALFAMVGIAGEDDDGNAPETPAPPPALIDDDQIAYIEQQLRDTGSDTAAFLKAFKIETIEGMTQDAYKRALTMFARKKAGPA